MIYVPEGSQLLIDDVQRWKRYKLDVRRFGLRIVPEAFNQVSDRLRTALDVVRASPRMRENAEQVSVTVDVLLRELAAISGSARGALPGDLSEQLRDDCSAWWVRLTDLPAEQWFAEDYEIDLATAGGGGTPYFTYGSVAVAQLDRLEIALPEEGGERPLAVIVPTTGGITRWTIPPLEPLPLVHEYCGEGGTSAHGRAVCIDTRGAASPVLDLNTPLGRVGGGFFATLYLHLESPVAAPVVGPLAEHLLKPTMALLERSGFSVVSEGPVWRIFARGEDVIHLYAGLAGKETDGVDTMSPLLVVASAGGDYSPEARAELFESVMDTVAAL